MTRENILEHLDYIRSAGRLEYNDYSELHDMVSELEQQSQDSIDFLKGLIGAIEFDDCGFWTHERIVKQLRFLLQKLKKSNPQDAISEYTHAQDRLSNAMDSFVINQYECGQDLSQLKVTKAESEDLQKAIRAVEEGDDLR